MVTIYGLKCIANGSVYVGSTKANLGKRMREHRCRLKAGCHATPRLQADWAQYGDLQFCIGTLEVLPTADLPVRREAELRWMQCFAERGLLYNEHYISMQPSPEAIAKGVANAHREPGLRWTAEANERRRIAQLGVPKGHGAKISATKRAKRGQVVR